MSSDPRAQGEKGELPTRKTSVYDKGNFSIEAILAGKTGKSAAQGDAAGATAAAPKDALKADVPKDTPPVNPKYSSETPIVLNKLPIFDDETRQS